MPLSQGNASYRNACRRQACGAGTRPPAGNCGARQPQRGHPLRRTRSNGLQGCSAAVGTLPHAGIAQGRYRTAAQQPGHTSRQDAKAAKIAQRRRIPGLLRSLRRRPGSIRESKLSGSPRCRLRPAGTGIRSDHGQSISESHSAVRQPCGLWNPQATKAGLQREPQTHQ